MEDMSHIVVKDWETPVDLLVPLPAEADFDTLGIRLGSAKRGFDDSVSDSNS